MKIIPCLIISGFGGALLKTSLENSDFEPFVTFLVVSIWSALWVYITLYIYYSESQETEEERSSKKAVSGERVFEEKIK